MKIVYFIGGLGNQMFQYAFYKTLKEKGEKVYGELGYLQKMNVHNGYELQKIFGLKIPELNNKFFPKFFFENFGFRNNFFIKILKKIFKYLNLFYYEENWNENIENKKNKKNILIYNGLWQSEEFFLEIEKEIRKKFQFPNFTEKENILIKNKIEGTNSVSIHIRRGDYVGCKNLEKLAPIFYYKRAIDYIIKNTDNPIFFIFSNDIAWCKENLKLEKKHYYIDWNKGDKSFRDMQLMSLCKHNIIPNSTFSWWGAWLNNNPHKIIIAPEKWFNDSANLNYSHVIPKSWIKIKNY